MRQWIETLARPAPLPSEVDRVRSEKARQWDAVRKEYVDRLAESLTQRTGRSRLYTAEAVLVIQGGRGLPMVRKSSGRSRSGKGTAASNDFV